MGAAYSLYIQSGELLQCRLHRISVFADDIGIISHHLVTELFKCIFLIYNAFINAAECTESVSAE